MNEGRINWAFGIFGESLPDEVADLRSLLCLPLCGTLLVGDRVKETIM